MSVQRSAPFFAVGFAGLCVAPLRGEEVEGGIRAASCSLHDLSSVEHPSTERHRNPMPTTASTAALSRYSYISSLKPLVAALYKEKTAQQFERQSLPNRARRQDTTTHAWIS